MKKNFVFDTNVLLHDPKAMFQFADNNVVIPIYVIEELDQFKKHANQLGRNARQVSRYIDQYRDKGNLSGQGAELPAGGNLRIMFVTGGKQKYASAFQDKYFADNKILMVALQLREQEGDLPVILISKDTNLRIRADALGISSEDYDPEAVAIDELYTGIDDCFVPTWLVDQLFDQNATAVDFLQKHLYQDEENPREEPAFHPNQFLTLRDISNDQHTALARIEPDGRSVVPLSRRAKDSVWGIRARNREQQFALDLLLDDRIKLVSLVGMAGTGKAQPLDAKILTPEGWKYMGQIEPGQQVMTPDGTPSTVLEVFPQGEKDIYRVQFTDGTSTECCKEHLWYTWTVSNRNNKRPGSVKSLEEIMGCLRYGAQKKRNHSIPLTKPIAFAHKEQPFDPYLMGCLLGDAAMSVGDPIKNALVEMGLWGCKSEDKFVPETYKFASIEQRIALLQGLMDTDGTIDKRGHKSFTTSSHILAKDFQFLVNSLGGTVSFQERQTSYVHNGERRMGKTSTTLHICLPNEIAPFRLPRKAERVRPRKKYFPRRYIDCIEYVGRKEAQCILIDHPEHLYLTDDCIVTHNTLLAVAAGLQRTLEEEAFQRVLISRPVLPMGRDIGYLPGSMEEKLTPWMQPIIDNVELLMGLNQQDKRNGRGYHELVDMGTMQIEALTYIRGRSIPQQYMIVDECFPYRTPIVTEEGPKQIGALFSRWIRGGTLPRVKSLEEESDTFVWKNITHMWHRGIKPLCTVHLSNRKIRCTSNHPFKTRRGWVAAGELQAGDLVVASNPEEHQTLLALDDEQEQLLLGSFLGDGGISHHGCSRIRIRWTHGNEQKEYCGWKSSFFGCEPKTVLGSGYRPDKPSVVACSKMIGESRNFPQVKDLCPQWVLESLDVRGLAIWYMDDGSCDQRANAASLHTESFDEDSVLRMIQRLKEFGIDARLQYSKGKSLIRMRKAGFLRLSALIAPWVHRSMAYKLHPSHRHAVGEAVWSRQKREWGYVVVKGVKATGEMAHVFDMEVEDTHNFLVPSSSRGARAGRGAVVVHNCQNLTPHEVKTIISRAGEGTKIVLTGDPYQIDHPYVDASDNGLVHAVNRFVAQGIAGHVTLAKGERSELAELAAHLL